MRGKGGEKHRRLKSFGRTRHHPCICTDPSRQPEPVFIAGRPVLRKRSQRGTHTFVVEKSPQRADVRLRNRHTKRGTCTARCTCATLVAEEQVLVPHHAHELRVPRQHLRERHPQVHSTIPACDYHIIEHVSRTVSPRPCTLAPLLKGMNGMVGRRPFQELKRGEETLTRMSPPMLMLSFMDVKMSWLKMRQYRKPAKTYWWVDRTRRVRQDKESLTGHELIMWICLARRSVCISRR